MQMNKQGTLSCKNVLSLQERYQSSHNRGSVASQQVTWMFSSKNPDDSLKAFACSPYIPPYPVCKHNVHDITKWHHNHCACAGEPCWLACTATGIPTSCFSTAMHRPSHQFHIPNFEPVTYVSHIKKLLLTIWPAALYTNKTDTNGIANISDTFWLHRLHMAHWTNQPKTIKWQSKANLGKWNTFSWKPTE